MKSFILHFVVLALIAVSCSKDDEEKFILDDKGLAKNMFTCWPAFNPSISYDFRTEYPAFTMPTRNLPYNGGNLAWTRESGWWSFFAGKNANSLVNQENVQLMLDRLNTDFAYIRDEMGWPPDMAVQNGYRSAVFLYGSGLSTDDASNTETGGWQSWVEINNTYWPIVLLSYYPIYCYDPACTYRDRDYNTRAVVHEGIHTMFSSMPGKDNKSWFHEGCNCWLQATVELDRSGSTDYSSLEFGWLATGSIIAPFIPIECYGGWLADGSFGGPDMEGLNNNTRSILGGIQYSEIFPTFLAENLGYSSIPWIWEKCTGHVLSGMGSVLGTDQMKRLIQEYRARVCLSDFGRYEQAMLKTYDTYMGKSIYSEYSTAPADDWKATPYTATTKGDGGWLIPDQETLPGWTGANIIPIYVDGESATVSFDPMGNNMSCQLCYRTSEGKTIYCDPVTEGESTVVTKVNKPANHIVFAVICNLDYTYTDSNLRKKHYNYRIKLGHGTVSAANINTAWYKWN